MECLGFEPGAAGWKAQTNPLSYGGTPYLFILSYCTLFPKGLLKCSTITTLLFKTLAKQLHIFKLFSFLRFPLSLAFALARILFSF